MVKTDRVKFLNAFGTLCLLFDKEASDRLLDIYFQALSGYSIEQVQDSISRAMGSCKFFPKPAELIEFIQGPGGINDKALIAWMEVDKAVKTIGPYASVRFSDPVIHGVIQSLGGWAKFQDCTEDEFKWVQKDFIARYKVMAQTNHHPTCLPGIIESGNIAHGFLKEVPLPVTIGVWEKKTLLPEGTA